MIALEYGFPIGLASGILEDLLDVGVVAKVYVDSRVQEFGYMPAVDINALTVKLLLEKLSSMVHRTLFPVLMNGLKKFLTLWIKSVITKMKMIFLFLI